MTDTPKPASKPFSRRDFVRFTSLAGTGAALASTPAMGWSAAPRKYPSEHHDVIVIGSGFGGAITACRLTEKGVAVLMIEQGRRWDQALPAGERRFSKNLYPDGRSTWLSHKTVIPLGPPLPIVKTTGVLQGRQLAGKTVLNGAAYGGGSIVFGGILAKPEEKIFKMVFPKEISYQEMERHYETVGKALNRSTIPDDVIEADCFKHVRVTKKQCEKAGLEWELLPTATQWDVVRQEIDGSIPASVTQGEAVYGVNSGAKTTLDNTYLRQAEESGLLDVRTLHQVQEIGQDANGLFTVSVDELHQDGHVIGKRTFTCKKLFLTAGTVSTCSLLVKAKAKGALPQLNDQVGQGWGNNGNVYALRLAVGESTGQQQGGPPAVGIRDLDNPSGPMFIEHPQLPLGIDLFGLLYFGIGISETRGSFRYDESNDKVVIDWPKNDPGQERINQSLLETMAKLNRANGGFTTSLLTYLKDKVKDDICYHPLGGCVMGKAADFFGRVKGYEGLYVNDGSFMPSASACTNPSFTIAALAERNIENIIAADFV
ncbi:MAG: GMC oxidoreductase [Pseudobdellovibrionaceae bacterium]|nr:GMC oxidoreductase [Pseudobdellovibrionaceae bacterium]